MLQKVETFKMERPQEQIKQDNRPNVAKQIAKQPVQQPKAPAQKPVQAQPKQTQAPANQALSTKVARFKAEDVPISWKHSIDIIKFIKNKNPQQSILVLEKVIKKKVAVPMPNREVGHRKGMTGGRYPEKASEFFIKALKSIISNATSMGMNADKLIIRGNSSKGSSATHPGFRRRQFKRTNIYLEAVEK